MDQSLLPHQPRTPWGALCCQRRRDQREFFIGDDEPVTGGQPMQPSGSSSRELYGDVSSLLSNWAHEKAVMEDRIAQAKRLALIGVSVALAASLGFVHLWVTAVPGIPSQTIGKTELAFDYFEETLKTWDSLKTSETFADDAVVRFYNQGTEEKRLFSGRSGAVDLLSYATSLGCARLQDKIVLREIDESAKMVYIAWSYPRDMANFCGPSAETYFFDDNYKIRRLNALVDWRMPQQHATLLAFNHFEKTQEAWDLAATAETFAKDAVVRFHNQGTGEEKVFRGKEGSKQLLLYAQELGCAKLRDRITAREVDEGARMVYISWTYPKSEGVANFCRPSTEIYTFDRDYKILRLNTLVDWRKPRGNATLEAFNYFEWILKTWDLDATSLTFATDAVVTFYNQGTKELKEFKGREGSKDLLRYATGLGCAKLHDDIKVRKVDEVSRSVYIAWDYPANTSSSGYECGSSAELYMFDEDYKIFRLDTLVDWRIGSAPL